MEGSGLRGSGRAKGHRRQLSANTQRGYENTLREAHVAQAPRLRNLGTPR